MKPINPLPIWGLVTILLVCALTFFFLAPNQEKLLHRLVQDGKTKRALKVLQGLSAAEKAKDPELYELTRLQLRRQLLNPKNKASAAAQLKESLQAFDRFPSRQEFQAEALSSVSLLDDPTEALKLVAPHLKTLPESARQALIDALVNQALASGKPTIAAEAYENRLRPFPPAQTNLVEAARLWRSAARPDKALQVLLDFEKQSGKEPSASGPMLAELKFSLLREVDRNGEAFALAAAMTAQSENALSRHKWLKLMRSTAGTPAHHQRLLEEYRRHVQAEPTDAAT